MRGQIRGLKQASRNAQDGISLIQTAEGALNESHSILQRMRELAVQSATDTNVNVDRKEIQKEIDELAKELTRISNTTEFNTQNLLAGGFKNTFHIGANQGQNVNLSIKEMDAKSLGVAASKLQSTVTAGSGITKIDSDSVTEHLGDSAQIDVTVTDMTIIASGDEIAGGVTSSGAYTGTKDVIYDFRVSAVSGQDVTGLQYRVAGSGDDGWKTVSANSFTVDGVTVTLGFGPGNAVDQAGSVTLTAAYADLKLQNGVIDIGDAVRVYGNQVGASLGDAKYKPHRWR